MNLPAVSLAENVTDPNGAVRQDMHRADCRVEVDQRGGHSPGEIPGCGFPHLCEGSRKAASRGGGLEGGSVGSDHVFSSVVLGLSVLERDFFASAGFHACCEFRLILCFQHCRKGCAVPFVAKL